MKKLLLILLVFAASNISAMKKQKNNKRAFATIIQEEVYDQKTARKFLKKKKQAEEQELQEQEEKKLRNAANWASYENNEYFKNFKLKLLQGYIKNNNCAVTITDTVLNNFPYYPEGDRLEKIFYLTCIQKQTLDKEDETFLNSACKDCVDLFEKRQTTAKNNFAAAINSLKELGHTGFSTDQTAHNVSEELITLYKLKHKNLCNMHDVIIKSFIGHHTRKKNKNICASMAWFFGNFLVFGASLEYATCDPNARVCFLANKLEYTYNLSSGGALMWYLGNIGSCVLSLLSMFASCSENHTYNNVTISLLYDSLKQEQKLTDDQATFCKLYEELGVIEEIQENVKKVEEDLK